MAKPRAVKLLHGRLDGSLFTPTHWYNRIDLSAIRAENPGLTIWQRDSTGTLLWLPDPPKPAKAKPPKKAR